MPPHDPDPAPGISPPAEVELLLASTRVRGVRECVGSGIDWDRFYELAAWHGLLPLVASSLKAAGPDVVPPAMSERMQEAFRRSAARNLFFASELARIVEWFREAGVPVIPLKGPALAFSVYDHFAQREFEDLDLLVPRPHVRAAAGILVAHGFTPALQLSKTALDSFIRTNYELPFDCEGAPLAIELHWGLQEQKFFSPALDPNAWWNRLESTTIGGVRLATPTRADTLLFLCVHGAKHCWERLKWVCDVARLVDSSPELDWPALHRRAQDMRVEREFLLGLKLASDLLGCVLPEAILAAAARDPIVPALCAEVRQQLNRGPAERNLLESAHFQLRLRKRARDKARYVLVNVFVPTAGEWKTVPLPGVLSPLYYALRPLRLLANVILGN